MSSKKAVSFILAVLTATSMLSACAGKPGTTESTQTSSGTDAKQSLVDAYKPDSTKTYKISMTARQTSPTDADGEILQYAEKQLNVDLNVWNLDSKEYYDQLGLRISGGDIPDLIRVQDAPYLQKFFDQGILTEIPEAVVEAYAPNIYKNEATLYPGCMAYGKIEGVQYGIPIMSLTNKLRLPLSYNTTWMKKLGVTKTPTTREEFIDLMTKFAKNDPDGNGQNDTYGFSYNGLMAFFGSYGLVIDPKTFYYVLEDGKFTDCNTSQKFKQAITDLNKLYKDGVLDPEFVLGAKSENTSSYKYNCDAFINGKIGFSCLGNYYHWFKNGAYSEVYDNGTTVPYVAGGGTGKELENSANKYDVTFGMPLNMTSGGGIKQYNMLSGFYAIGKNVADKGAIGKALQVLDAYSASDDKTYTCGVQGKHWEWLNKSKDLTTTLEPYKSQSGWDHKIGCGIGMAVDWKLNGFREEYAVSLGFDKGGIQSLIQTPTEAMSENMGEMFTIRDQAMFDMITGAKPLTYFDDYVKSYNAAGGTECYNQGLAWYNANVSK